MDLCIPFCNHSTAHAQPFPKPNAASDATPAASTPSFPISTLPSAPSKGDAPLGNRQPSVKSGTAPLPRRRSSATDNPLPIRKSAGPHPIPPRAEQPSASAPIPASTHQYPAVAPNKLRPRTHTFSPHNAPHLPPSIMERFHAVKVQKIEGSITHIPPKRHRHSLRANSHQIRT